MTVLYMCKSGERTADLKYYEIISSGFDPKDPESKAAFDEAFYATIQDGATDNIEVASVEEALRIAFEDKSCMSFSVNRNKSGERVKGGKLADGVFGTIISFDDLVKYAEDEAKARGCEMHPSMRSFIKRLKEEKVLWLVKGRCDSFSFDIRQGQRVYDPDSCALIMEGPVSNKRPLPKRYAALLKPTVS